MRISDWSSDVCSSDLSSALIANGVDNLSDTAVYALSLIALSHGRTWKTRAATVSGVMLLIFAVGILIDVGRRYIQGSEPIRSEEQTSELQSLMSRSYAVLCMKNKIHYNKVSRHIYVT